MRRIRFSIASLLGLVLFVAVAFAALREANDLWDSGLFTLMLGLLVTSVLLAALRDGRRRASWLGLALFGWSYLIASLIPQVGSRLLTTRALVYLDSMFSRTTPMGVAVADFDSDGQVDLFVANASAPNALYRNQGDGTFLDVTSGQTTTVSASSGGVIVWKPSLLWRPLAAPGGTSENFVRIGHSLLALVLAFLGGCLSQSMYTTGRSERAEEPDVLPLSPPPANRT
jgi:hypothetical protein